MTDTSKKYTDQDVQRLVKVGTWIMREYKKSTTITRGTDIITSDEELELALAPFKADPEEELIEAIALRLANRIGLKEKEARQAAADVYDVVKGRGLPS